MTSIAALGEHAGASHLMVDAASRTVGSYASIVVALRTKLREVYVANAARANSDTQLQVIVLGHGGRDTNCCLAVVQAVAFAVDLRENVHVTVCSCSWPDDSWEPVMRKYVDLLMKRGTVPNGMLTFEVLKYGEEPERLLERVNQQLVDKHLIVQCEQGVDLFTEPVTSEWLQDNFEDLIIPYACMKHAETQKIQSLLVQTNSDLYLSRGIDKCDLEARIFGMGRLQTNAFTQSSTFQSEEALATLPVTLQNLAVQLGGQQNKSKAFV